MKQFLANIAQRLAPRTVANLRKLNALDPQLGGGAYLSSSAMNASSGRCAAKLMNCGGRTGVSLSCTTSSSSGRTRMWERQCLLLTLMLLEPSSESPTWCPKTPSPIHPQSGGS